MNEKTNLFIFTHDYSGVKTYTNELVKYLQNHENFVVHLVFWQSREYKEYTVIRESDLTTIYIPSVITAERELKKYSRRTMDLLAPILAEKQNLVFHLNQSLQVYLGMEAQERYGAKVIYTVHFLRQDFSGMTDKDYNLENKIDILIEALEQLLIKKADQIICVTEFAMTILIKYLDVPEDKIIAIHNGVSEGEQHNVLSTEEKCGLKKELGFSDTDQILLFVGKIENRKGVKHLIRAFNKVEESNVKLVIAGNGDYNLGLEHAKNNWGRIVFTGKIASEELTKLYSVASIGIITSVFEQCSYVALEMMRFALPIIVTEAPGLIELFEHKKDAYVVPLLKNNDDNLKLEVDEVRLSEAISYLMRNNELRKNLSLNTGAKWNRKYKVERMGMETVSCYRELLKNKQHEIIAI